MDVMTSMYDDFQRYLAAKKSVDDRALNAHVWRSLQTALPCTQSELTVPLRIIEIGGGIGTMIERVLKWGLLTHAHYTLVDEVADNIAMARERLPRQLSAAGFDVTLSHGIGEAIQITRPASAEQPAVHVDVELIQADCFDFAARSSNRQRADLLIAHALLDLFDIARALPQLIPLLKTEGLLYATINFDGDTILQPVIDRGYDDQIEAAYHATMDARITNGIPSGDSRSGRHLFGHLRNAGLSILDAGSSDWVVFAGAQGYPEDEAYFLHFIVDTMAGALHHLPELGAARFAAWIKERHTQIERGDLVYIAHQLDFLAQMPR